MEDPTTDRVFRPRKSALFIYGLTAIGAAGVTAALLLLPIIATDREEWTVMSWILGFFAIASAVAVLWFMLRSVLVRVAAKDSDLVVFNYFSTRRILWTLIDRFEVGGGYWGIVKPFSPTGIESSSTRSRSRTWPPGLTGVRGLTRSSMS